MKQWPLRTRFILAYAGLIVLGFGGLALLAGRQISQGAVGDFEQGLVTQTTLVASGLREQVEHFMEGESDQASLEDTLSGYAQQLNGRLVLMDATGRPWLDSDGLPTTAIQIGQPEIIAAFDGRATYEVRANEQGITTIYTAAPIIEDGETLSVLQVSTPLAAAQEIVVQRWLVLGLGVAGLTVAALAASLGLASSLIRPLEQLRQSTLRMAGGDLSQRLPEDRADEIGQLAASFNVMAERLQAILEEQRAFASNASHELRTPLTTIRLRSEALRMGTLDEATARQYIVEIDDEMTRLSDLVSGLILLSRFDPGRSEPGREQIDPVRLAHNLMREWLPQAEARQIQLVLNAPDQLPSVEANLVHMQIVFRNLLENALKYTPGGGNVTWRLWAEGDYLRAEISDTGQGIAQEELAHLFERFYRVDKAHSRDVSGAGLGLSLVQSIVHFYGGRINIHSPGLGQGTAARIEWPLRSAWLGKDNGVSTR